MYPSESTLLNRERKKRTVENKNSRQRTEIFYQSILYRGGGRGRRMSTRK